ncbi:MAG: hypothetical protein IAX22_06555 [Candidatus Bathyarchaeota archaeon]|nr:hypothetical protein [Candidatus Bathyarchaeota archaeon]
MDFIPDSEFHDIFARTSKKVNFKGASTAAQIDDRLIKKIHRIQNEYESDPLSQMQAESRIEPLKKLLFSGFGRRAIDEAIANPQGKIARTLKLDQEEIQRIKARRKRKLIS